MAWKVRQKPVLPWADLPRHGDPHFVWENKQPKLPQPGAQAYAWESYGLVEFSPIGPSIAVKTPFTKLTPQLYQSLATFLQGIGTQAGGVQFQALFDPTSPNGYPAGFGIDAASNRLTGAAYMRNDPLAPNTPYPSTNP